MSSRLGCCFLYIVFLVGSLASMYYSKPRFTNDIDLVLQVKPSQIPQFQKLFDIETFYFPPIDIVSNEIIRGGSFNLIHQESGIKIDIMVPKKVGFYESEFHRRKEVELLPGFEAFIASPEDIILKKLDYYREGESEKHILDIKSILAENTVNMEYLNH